MTRRMEIAGTVIDDESDCYVIAEVGHNHQGSVEKAKQIFRMAKDCGCDAVKLQKRDNRTLFTRERYESPYENRNSFGPTYGAHREALEFGRAEYLELQAYAAELGLHFFSTCFDIPSADFLAELDAPAYKIASGDLTNLPLLRHVARLGKPLIVSTGGGSLDDVRRACETVLPLNRQLCVMQCTTGYPAEYEELNLRVIETFRREFPGLVIGYSGHDTGIAMAVAAYVLGARVVEKHVTVNRTWRGTDQAFSLEHGGLRRMVRDLRRVRAALGDGVKRHLASEAEPLKKQAKIIVAARDLPAGHRLGESDIAIRISKDKGLPPYAYDGLLGRVTARPLKADDPILPDGLAGQ